MSRLTAPMLAAGLLYLVAMLVACCTLRREFRRQNLLGRDAVWLVVVLAGSSRIFAMLLYAFEHDDWALTFVDFVTFGVNRGATQYGAVYGGIVLIVLFAFAKRIPALLLFDLCAPTAAMALAIGRLGCYAANCCTGFVLSSQWQLPSFMPYNTIFPASLVDVAVNFAIYLKLERMPIDISNSGKRVGWFLILTASTRFLIEFVRTSEPVFWSLTLVQTMALPLIFVGIIFAKSRRSFE